MSEAIGQGRAPLKEEMELAPSLVRSLQFDANGVRGYVTGGGQHGVEIVSMRDRHPGTRPMCMNLEHYYSRSCREGLFVPRAKARVHTELLEDGVRIHIDPFDRWLVETEVVLRVLDGPMIEACYTFSFLSRFEGFEALVSNYFLDPTEPFLHLGGEWRRPEVSEREHRFWPRGRREADNIAAIYPGELTPSDDIELTVDEEAYDHPIMVTPVRDTPTSIVNIVEPRYCSSLSANRRWNAHDFSLVAMDVDRGETVSCRAWLVCCELGSLDDAIGLQDQLV